MYQSQSQKSAAFNFKIQHKIYNSFNFIGQLTIDNYNFEYPILRLNRYMNPILRWDNLKHLILRQNEGLKSKHLTLRQDKNSIHLILRQDHVLISKHLTLRQDNGSIHLVLRQDHVLRSKHLILRQD